MYIYLQGEHNYLLLKLTERFTPNVFVSIRRHKDIETTPSEVIHLAVNLIFKF